MTRGHPTTTRHRNATAACGDDAAYRRLEEMLAEGPVPLIRLTDEELVAADPLPEEARLAATPYLDRLPDDDARQLATTVALRALVSRGAVAVDDLPALRATVSTANKRAETAATRADSGDIDLGLRFAPDLDLALGLRTGADKVVVVEQVAAGDVRDWHYVYVHGERFCLEEAVAPAGQHAFTARDLSAESRHLAGLADPLGAAGERDGPPRELDAQAVADGRAGPPAPVLETSRLITQLLELRPTGGHRQGRLSVTYLTGDGLWLVQSDPATTSDTMTARTLSRAGLHRLMERVLRT